MKPNERDELLIRIDERSRNTWQLVERMEEHQATQNGTIREIIEQVAANAEGRKQQGKSIGRLWTIIIVAPTGSGVIAGILKWIGVY